MYYLKEIEDKVRVSPDMFGSDLSDAVLRVLRGKFEGRYFKDTGMVLVVTNPKVAGEGTVIPGDPAAYYDVKFEALTFMPSVNEVMYADVKEVVEFGAFVSIGPYQGLLHVSQVGKEKYHYDKKGKGLSSRAAKKSVKKGDSLVVKVSTASLKSNPADTKVGLTMRPEGLGKLDWLEKKKQAPAKAKKKKSGGSK